MWGLGHRDIKIAVFGLHMWGLGDRILLEHFPKEPFYHLKALPLLEAIIEKTGGSRSVIFSVFYKTNSYRNQPNRFRTLYKA